MRESRVKRRRVIKLPYFEVFLGMWGRGLEGLRGVSTTSNPSFLWPIWMLKKGWGVE